MLLILSQESACLVLTDYLLVFMSGQSGQFPVADGSVGSQQPLNTKQAKCKCMKYSMLLKSIDSF